MHIYTHTQYKHIVQAKEMQIIMQNIFFNYSFQLNVTTDSVATIWKAGSSLR